MSSVRNRGSLLGAVAALALAWPAASAEVVPRPQPPAPAATIEALSGDETVRRAGGLIAEGKRAEAIALLEGHLTRSPKDEAARQALLATRIAQLEEEIRTILARQSTTRDLAVGPPDYEAVKARSEEVVRRRLEVAEYFAAAGRPGEAIDACDAILKDHIGHPAPLALKWRMLKELQAAALAERKALLKEQEVRHSELMNEVIDKAIMPREKEKIVRGVMIFDEDIAEIDRERVRLRLRERVSLENMAGVDVRKVIETLFAIAGINYVILDSAIGSETLSINLVDESLENILQIVSRQVGLRYNYVAGTVYITSSTSTVLETEIIRLQSGLTDVLAQPQAGAGGGGAGGAGGAGGGQVAPDPFAQQGQGGEQAKSDLERFLDKIPDIIVGWPPEGTIYLDRKSNSVFVRATPTAIAEVKRLVQALDYNSVQVLIEARFVLVSESAGFQLGLDIAGRGQRTVGGRRIGAEGGTNFNGGTSPSPLGSPVSAAGLPAGITVSGILGDLDGQFLGATLRALETKGKANSLAEPKILTLNNATGLISLENEISYVESYSTNSSTSSSTTGNGNVVSNNVNVLTPQLAKDKEEISLKIVPSVARNSDIITLRLFPRVRQQLGPPRQVPFSYQPSQGADPIQAFVERPEFSDRKVETVLHVKSGQTIALGGLVQNLDREDTSGVPWISRVPLLGYLFRNTSKDMDRSNLVIFVTAYIMDPSGAKAGDEVRLLRDNARVALDPPVRDAVDQRAREESARREADAGAPALPQKGRGR